MHKTIVVMATSLVAAGLASGIVYGQQLHGVTGYMPVDIKGSFQSIIARYTAQKSAVEAAHNAFALPLRSEP